MKHLASKCKPCGKLRRHHILYDDEGTVLECCNCGERRRPA